MTNFEDEITLNNIHFAYQLEAGRFTFVSDQILQSFNLSFDDFSTEGILQQIYPEDLIKIKESYFCLLKDEFSGVVKFKLGKEDAQRWYSVTPFLSDTKNKGKIIFGSFYEITAEVDNVTSIAKYANKKNSILHMLAHDLRGPLNIARSLVISLDREITDANVLERTRYISTIIEQSISLITDLVSREFLDTLEASLVKRNIDVVLKLREYLEECRLSSQTAARNFSLLSDQKQLFADLDEAKFMQIMNNFVSNSLKFTQAGGSIIVKVEDHGDTFRLIFQDDGIGIPKHLLPKVFDKFTTASRPGLEGEPTIGLGLSIVKIIVQWHDGRIWCESEEGKGTSFFIEFPKKSAKTIV